MSKGDDQRVQAGINQQNQTQQANAAAQTQRTNQANDIFYGTPGQQSTLSSTQAPSGGMNQGGQQATGEEPAYDPKDPKSVDAYIAYMQQQPGVNPSVKNDPGYWRQKMLADTNAGGLGPDANYVKGKMMTPEGAPAGSGGFGRAGTGASGGVAGQAVSDYGNIAGRYSDFADTGGFSPNDLNQIRARALSPQRAIYANAQSGLNRQRALQGGYSPGFSTATARMARERSQGMSDATTGAESNIASMVQQGKLAGLGGMTSAYGATPGLANMFGQQALEQGQQQIGQQGSAGNINTQQLDLANAGRGGAMRTIGGIAKVGAGLATAGI